MANKNEMVSLGGVKEKKDKTELIEKLDDILKVLKESPAVKAFELFIKLSPEEKESFAAKKEQETFLKI